MPFHFGNLIAFLRLRSSRSTAAIAVLVCLGCVAAPRVGAQAPGSAPGHQPSSWNFGQAPAAPTAPVDVLQKRLTEAATARNSGDPSAVAHANILLLATAFHKLGNVRIAEAAFPEARELYSRSLAWEDNPETHVGLAICALYLNRPDDSLVEASKALLLDPNNARAFNIQGKAWMKKRDFPKAVESLQKSVQLHPEFESAYALGVALLSTNDPDRKQKAAEVFDNIVASLGDNGSLHVMFGHAYRDAEMQDEAIRELRKAVALDTRTPHAHYFLGLAQLWKNEWVETPEIRQEFVIELKNFPQDFLSNYFLGYLDSNARRYDEAAVHLQAAAKIDPTWPEPWLFLGLNAYAQGDKVNAESYLRKCIELTGDENSRGNYQVRRAYVTLGRILTASGREKEAAPFLERAREFQKLSLAEAQQEIASKASEDGSVSPAAVVALLERQEDRPVAEGDQASRPSSAARCRHFGACTAFRRNKESRPRRRSPVARDHRQQFQRLGHFGSHSPRLPGSPRPLPGCGTLGRHDPRPRAQSRSSCLSGRRTIPKAFVLCLK